MLHTEQWVVSEVKGGEINVQLVDFLLCTWKEEREGGGGGAREGRGKRKGEIKE